MVDHYAKFIDSKLFTSFVNCSEIWSLIQPHFRCFFLEFSSSFSIPRPQEQVEKWYSSYLMNLTSSLQVSMVCSSSCFLFSSLPLLLSNRPSRLLFLPWFWFSFLLLTHFSLHAQGKWHAGWLGSVFYLEEGCVCCSNDYCRFWKKV